MARLAGRAEQFRMSNEGLVVQRIYDVAEAEGGAVLSGWPDVLASVTQWLGADKANTFLVDARGAVLETTTHEVDDGAQRVYHQHYQAIDPRFELAKGSVDIVHSDVRSLDWKAFERTEIFNDYLRRFGVEYSMFVNLRFAPGKLAPQAFFRPRDAKPFGAADVRRLEALLPHVSRSLRLRELLLEARMQRGDLQRVLDAMSVPVCVLDDVGRVVCVSARATKSFALTPLLTCTSSGLTSSRPQLAEALRVAVAETATFADSAPTGLASTPRVVVVPRERARPMGLLFFPLRPGSSLRAEGAKGARVLVAVHDPEQATQLDVDVLQQLYGLTPTEAALAAALAAGQTVLQFALARGSSEQTVRVQLKRVLDKTKTARQADLVRVLLAGGALQLVP